MSSGNIHVAQHLVEANRLAEKTVGNTIKKDLHRHKRILRPARSGSKIPMGKWPMHAKR
ncbi:MAG: hypothetical protein JSS93_06685 [Bacteroidetes bacterium]|nr:hypothetical protein [Bacteroidota bacterium]